MRYTSRQVELSRAWLGLTRAEIAAAMDTTERAVRSWEDGARNCSGPAAVLLGLLADMAPRPTATARPVYRKLQPGDAAGAGKYTAVELKADGWYSELIGSPAGWELRGRSGDVLRSGPEAAPRCWLRCELVANTEWAQAQPGLYGKFMAWDALDCHGNQLTRLSLVGLVAELAEAGLPVVVSQRFAVADLLDVWDRYVNGDGWEGVVLRDDAGHFAKMKYRETGDFVVMDVVDESIICGAYTPGGRLVELVHVHAPAVADSAVPGAVVEVSGLGITNSGSMKNPRFERLRPDKNPGECIRKVESE